MFWRLNRAVELARGLAAGDRSGELLVLDPVGLVGGGAELLVPVLLVFGEVPLEPSHLAVPFERQDVRGDAVEEPAVVGDHDRAAGERLQAGFEKYFDYPVLHPSFTFLIRFCCFRR